MTTDPLSGRMGSFERGALTPEYYHNVPEPVVEVRRENPDYVLEDVNPAFKATVPSGEHSRGRSINDVRWFDRSVERSLLEQARQGDHATRTVRRQTAEGYRTFQIYAIPVEENGTCDRVLLHYRDCTEASLQQQQLSVYDRVLRHNLRNSLNAVIGYAEHICESGADDDVVEAAEQITGAASDLLELGDLAATFRTLPAREETMDLQSSLSYIADIVDTRTPMTIDLKQPETTTELEQRVVIAIRLLCLHVAETADEPARLRMRAGRAEGWITISLVCEGVDLIQGQLRALAGDEETPLNHPAGLDMWVVQWIIASANGHIDVDSSQADRTDITIAIPEREPAHGGGW